jgi:hypothetical protein
MDMKRMFLIIISLFLLNTGCDDLIEKIVPIRYAIRVYNNSNIDIYYYSIYILPDTLLPTDKPKYLIEVPSDEMKEFYDFMVDDPKFTRLDAGDRISIFILSKAIVDTKDWKEIREKNMILERYEYNTEELMNIGYGYRIYYPYKR